MGLPRRVPTALLVLALALVPAPALLAGCGQTGPLYFDEDPPADQLPPSKKTPAKAPAAIVTPAVEPAPQR